MLVVNNVSLILVADELFATSSSKDFSLTPKGYHKLCVNISLTPLGKFN